jgi:TP901 family phage tail tape measure protein
MAREGTEGVSRFGATLVALGNDGASTEKEILNMAQRIAGAGHTVGATETDVLALSNTLASMGINAELGGGVATRVLLKMYSAVKDGGPKLDAFARAAGMSAADFAKAYGDSPVKALGMVTAGLDKANKSGGNVVGMMKDMGIKGTEETQVMLALAGAGDLLNHSLDVGARAWSENTALVNEANKRYETTASKVKIAWNNIKDAAIDAGAVLLPIISGVAESVAGLAKIFGDLPAPMKGIITSFGGVVVVAALLGGAALTLIPKIAATRAAFTALNTAGSAIPGTFMKIAKGAAAAGAIAAVGVALAKWAESDYMSKIDTGMGKVNSALQAAASEAPGAASALDGVFKNREGGALIRDVDNLDGALKRTFHKDWQQTFNDWGSGLMHGLTGVKGSTEILSDSFGRLDDGLAEMVSSGNAAGAAEAFDKIQMAAKAQGIGIDELLTKFPGYADALKQADADARKAAAGGDAAAGGIKGAGDAASGAIAPSSELSKALDAVGISADGTVTDLEKFSKALLDAGLRNLSARDAARGFQGAIDAVDESLKANGKTLDITTEKGRNNQAAMDGVASSGLALVEANAKNGESQEVLQGNLNDTYNALVDTGKKFGLTDTAAQDLARSILRVPKGVSVQSWMSSEAKRMADETKGAMDRIDGRVVRTYSIDRKTTIYETIRSDSVNLGTGPSHDGRKVAYASGGEIEGAGTGTSDEVPILASAGEHMLDRGDVIKMGGQQAVYKFRAALQAGNLPALAGGGSVGRSVQYSGQPISTPAGARQIVNFHTYNPVNEPQSRTVEKASSLLAATGGL